ncbi:hypothetical protein F5146DRAFT_1000243 [Armillaria mellea]|nr:hypothetical protein F5146DRAFT_1000243 [Armillaria mellea]
MALITAVYQLTYNFKTLFSELQCQRRAQYACSGRALWHHLYGSLPLTSGKSYEENSVYALCTTESFSSDWATYRSFIGMKFRSKVDTAADQTQRSLLTSMRRYWKLGDSFMTGWTALYPERGSLYIVVFSYVETILCISRDRLQLQFWWNRFSSRYHALMGTSTRRESIRHFAGASTRTFDSPRRPVIRSVTDRLEWEASPRSRRACLPFKTIGYRSSP